MQHSKAMKLGSVIVLNQLTKKLPNLVIATDNGYDMHQLRQRITKVKNDYSQKVEEARHQYKSTLRE